MATDGSAFLNGLSQSTYVFDPRHTLLACDAWKEEGPNIGRAGTNLTIAFVSFNRVALSERLLVSIRDHISGFAGEVLVVDAGSTASELRQLGDVCATLPYKTRIIEIENTPSAGSVRNKAISHVRTEWLMWLDNDLHLKRNPLVHLQREISTLGCHFMSLPVLDIDGRTVLSSGGHLSISHEHGELYVSSSSATEPNQMDAGDTPAFLGSFFSGGACVINCASFELTGGYDEFMRSGYEDIDFSVRLFQRGYKIGASG